MNRALWEARSNGGDHPTEAVHLGDEGECVALHLIGERLHRVAATERIGSSCHASLVGQHLLGAQGKASRRFGREREGLILAVDVQALRATEHRSKRLICGAHDIVVDRLCREGGAGGLHMEATEERLLALCAVAIAHDARPDATRRAELRHLFKDVSPRREEEGEPRGDGVNFETACDRCVDIGNRIGKGEGKLLRGGGSRLTHVIARDADRVPLRQLGGAPLKDVGD